MAALGGELVNNVVSAKLDYKTDSLALYFSLSFLYISGYFFVKYFYCDGCFTNKGNSY